MRELSSSLSLEELARYDRHLNLVEVGLAGQEKLKAARVLLIGAGGLGSPLGLYLAAAGIGCLGIVDFDTVDLSNLQRQVLHGSKDVGRAKVASARDRLEEINPHTRVVTHQCALTALNALQILADYDVVVDGSDNFTTRYLVNDACVLLGRPLIYGSVYRFAGQVSVFHPTSGGPCYRCLHPEPPAPGLVPSCAEGGVLGVLPGVIGTLQASETIKWILGAGRSLLGRLLLFDALAMTFRELQLKPDPSCRMCGPEADISELIDHQQFCSATASAHCMAEVTPAEFLTQWESGGRPVLIDVRQPHEWEVANLSEYGAVLVPLEQLRDHISLFEPNADIVIHCKTGGRGVQAQVLLQEAGFRQVRNLAGGLSRWCDEVGSKQGGCPKGSQAAQPEKS